MSDVTVSVLDPSIELRLHRLTGAFLAGYRNANPRTATSTRPPAASHTSTPTSFPDTTALPLPSPLATTPRDDTDPGEIKPLQRHRPWRPTLLRSR